MDDTTNDGGTWALSRLGFAIDAYVDRQLNNPQVITDHSAAYGMDSNGNLYKVGQPTTVQTVSPVQSNNSILMLLVLAVAFYASRN
ncbi:MAG: hypothetical protein WCC39_02580 [Telluria sp.]